MVNAGAWVFGSPACERCGAVTLATAPIPCFVDGSVLGIVGMPARTLRTKRCCGDTTLHVDLVRNSFEVVGPYATPPATSMIPFETDGRLSFEEVVSQRHLAVEPKEPVSLAAGIGQPQGAAIGTTRIDLRPKAFVSGKLDGHGRIDLLCSGPHVEPVAAPSILPQTEGD